MDAAEKRLAQPMADRIALTLWKGVASVYRVPRDARNHTRSQRREPAMSGVRGKAATKWADGPRLTQLGHRRTFPGATFNASLNPTWPPGFSVASLGSFRALWSKMPAGGARRTGVESLRTSKVLSALPRRRTSCRASVCWPPFGTTTCAVDTLARHTFPVRLSSVQGPPARPPEHVGCGRERHDVAQSNLFPAPVRPRRLTSFDGHHTKLLNENASLPKRPSRTSRLLSCR
jgi:hypothetical protein